MCFLISLVSFAKLTFCRRFNQASTQRNFRKSNGEKKCKPSSNSVALIHCKVHVPTSNFTFKIDLIAYIGWEIEGSKNMKMTIFGTFLVSLPFSSVDDGETEL